MLSPTEENYLKVIFALSSKNEQAVHTNAIATELNVAAATATDMCKKLAVKKLVLHKKYKGVLLTKKGYLKACLVIRKHRLWETFLVEKLQFKWDEVHEIAEQLEHVTSEELINRLEVLLGSPKTDPHGDPIPDKQGYLPPSRSMPLATVDTHDFHVVRGVADQSTKFLQLLNKLNIGIGSRIKIIEKFDFDHSMAIKVDQNKQVHISELVAKNIIVK
jgi:DtxR family Mn-dependent transcriptional regulator